MSDDQVPTDHASLISRAAREIPCGETPTARWHHGDIWVTVHPTEHASDVAVVVSYPSGGSFGRVGAGEAVGIADERWALAGRLPPGTAITLSSTTARDVIVEGDGAWLVAADGTAPRELTIDVLGDGGELLWRGHWQLPAFTHAKTVSAQRVCDLNA